MIEITAANSGQTIRLRNGEKLRCTLPETPTSGYRWELQPTSGLKVDSDTFQSSHPSRPGAGGLRSFELTAQSAGIHDLRLVNRRSWDQASSAGTFQLTVIVE